MPAKAEKMTEVDRHELTRDRRADIGAEDHGSRLRQRHDARVDETDYHDRRRARALDRRRRHGADADARQLAFRGFRKQFFKLFAA